MAKVLRDYNVEEQESFAKLFETSKEKEVIFEGIASKFYRHEYCNVGHDLFEEVTKWFDECGLKWKVTDTSPIQITIDLV